MVASKQALRDILGTLVIHWGMDVVRHELTRIDGAVGTQSSDEQTHDAFRLGKLKSRKRVTPREILARYELPDRLKSEATQLAVMYEAKKFLPTIADVKRFLEGRGRKVEGIKNRDQAFVKVIDLVLTLPPEGIRQLRYSAVHGQPARLGPISDAITFAGDDMRANRRR